MNIYETIKAAISVKQAAKQYGLTVNRNDMACCPFHNDRHPSLKLNEDYFFCFGCGAKGDVIDFVASLFDLSSYEAAKRLAADFGISTEPGHPVAAPHKPKHPHIRQFREDEMLCFRVLTDYLHLLEDWKIRYEAQIIRIGMTMQQVVDLLSDEYGWSDSVSNLSAKLQRESIRYKEVVELADVLGCDIVWQKRRDK